MDSCLRDAWREALGPDRTAQGGRSEPEPDPGPESPSLRPPRLVPTSSGRPGERFVRVTWALAQHANGKPPHAGNLLCAKSQSSLYGFTPVRCLTTHLCLGCTPCSEIRDPNRASPRSL